jgi:hypothetical protein
VCIEGDREEAAVTAGSATVEEPLLTIPRPPRFWISPFGWSFAAATGVAVVSVALFVASNFILPGESIVTLRGVMASKGDFFADEKVQQLLLEHHIRVEVTSRGSREVAIEVINQETEHYDFAFPSGQPAADLIKNDRSKNGKYHRTVKLFSSPIVLASYREYAETLVKNEVAVPHYPGQGKPLYYTLDTAKFIELGERGATWNSVGIGEYQNEDGKSITNGNRVLAHSSGVCRSNSAGTYLGLVAFVKNGGRAAQTEAEVNRLAEELQPFITATGMPESDVFEAYATPEGRSQGPIVVVYEHQYLEYQILHQRRTGEPDADRVLLYPMQEFQTDPELISLKEGGGDRLAELLAEDPALRERMMELGYRVLDRTDTTGTKQLFQYLTASGVPTPAERTDLTKAELPELDLLENLIRTVGRCKE